MENHHKKVLKNKAFLKGGGDVESKHQLLLACMAYWRRCQSERPTAMQVLAILVCLTSHEFRPDSAWIDKTKKLRISDKSPKAVKNFDRDLVHSFSNLQAVLFQSVLLNNLLGNPLPQLSMLFWSGITMYNLCQEFSSVQDALQFFEFDKKFHSEVTAQLRLWCKLLDIDLSSAAIPPRKTKKRNRKRGPKSGAIADILAISDVNGEDEKANDSCSDRDINNRFALLSV